MTLIVVALAILLASSLTCLAGFRYKVAATRVGVGGAVLGGALGGIGAILSLLQAEVDHVDFEWTLPLGSFALGIDPLTCWFLVPVFFLPAVAAVYGRSYLHHSTQNLAFHWCFYNLLTFGMALLTLARDGLLFLISWEVMSLAPFFLVTFDHHKASVRSAGWTYLVATHLGTACLLALFMMMSDGNNLAFSNLSAPGREGLIFALAILGFGAKAGFVPLHVWLPEAHPAAPSHVSAVMSGVMVKMGIYGLVRVMTLLGPPHLAWAYSLLLIGIASGILGILFSLTQHDLKRLLAYSTVENVGILTIGLGLGTLGMATGSESLAVLGMAGLLYHVWSHALMKALLFLGAGCVLHNTGTVELEKLGGLLKRMPQTGTLFLVGVCAISALPPLCGLVGELLLLRAAWAGGLSLAGENLLAVAGAAGALALIGGLVAFTFVRAFGMAFLGEARSHLPEFHEVEQGMMGPMMVLGVCVALLGLGAPAVIFALAPVVAQLTPGMGGVGGEILAGMFTSTWSLIVTSGLLLSLILGLTLLRRYLLEGRQIEDGVTWDCGYQFPTPRMQYTSSSFSQPITVWVERILGSRNLDFPVKGLFPKRSAWWSDTPDSAQILLYEPLFHAVRATLMRLRWLQHGNTHLYVLYILVTLVVLLVWKL